MGEEAHHWTANIISPFCKRDVSSIQYGDTEHAIYGDAYHDL